MTARITIDRRWCKKCAICVEFCPTDVLELDKKGRPRIADEEKCTECSLCELRCPDLAIEIRGENHE